MSNVWKIADVVYVQSVHNYSHLMAWATPDVRQKLADLSVYDIKWMFDSVEKSRLACGTVCVLYVCVCVCACVHVRTCVHMCMCGKCVY